MPDTDLLKGPAIATLESCPALLRVELHRFGDVYLLSLVIFGKFLCFSYLALPKRDVIANEIAITQVISKIAIKSTFMQTS
jgi:hypothetical protein